MGQTNEGVQREEETGVREFTEEESALAKSKVQDEADKAMETNEGNGLIVMATGSGKSRIGIKRIEKELYKAWPSWSDTTILLVVPTIKLRDETWKAEFEKWNMLLAWQFVTPICYDSLHTITGKYGLILLDEWHNITIANAVNLLNGTLTYNNIVCMTATQPTNKEKLDIQAKLGIKLVYELTLDRAVELGVIAPYQITMIGVPLDDKIKYIKGGTKEKPFFNTEVKAYNYINRLATEAPTRFNVQRRMHLIYGLKSKVIAAQKILEYLIPDELRGLIFCANKEQANQICPYRYYSKPTKPKKPNVANIKTYTRAVTEYIGNTDYEAFINGEITRIACCQALNEGINIPDLDFELMVQILSGELNFVQRTGRGIRFRVGHIGKIIGLYAKDTIDEQWAWSATRKLNKSAIRWIDYEKLRRGEETIKF